MRIEVDVLVFPEVVGFCANEEAEVPCCDAEEDFVACAVERFVFVEVDLELCEWGLMR